MNKTLFTFINILLFSAITVAQEPMSLDEAINYALENSPIVNIKIMELEEASIQVSESRLFLQM